MAFLNPGRKFRNEKDTDLKIGVLGRQDRG